MAHAGPGAAGTSAIYIAAPEPETGKSTIALGILHRLAATVAKVGVFRPIIRHGEDRDYILDLLLAHATAGLPYERCVGVTYLSSCTPIVTRRSTTLSSVPRDGGSLRRRW